MHLVVRVSDVVRVDRAGHTGGADGCAVWGAPARWEKHGRRRDSDVVLVLVEGLGRTSDHAAAFHGAYRDRARLGARRVILMDRGPICSER